MGAAIVQAIGYMISKVLADNLLRFIATKALLAFLAIVVVPILLNNLLYDVMEIMFNFVNGKLSDTGLSPTTLQVTGVAAWLMVKCKIVESFSFITSALILRASLSMIPFVRI